MFDRVPSVAVAAWLRLLLALVADEEEEAGEEEEGEEEEAAETAGPEEGGASRSPDSISKKDTNRTMHRLDRTHTRTHTP